MGDKVPLAVALVAGALLVPLCRIAGRRLNLVDRPGELKIHDYAVPVTGGLGVTAAVVLSLGVLDELPPVEMIVAVILALAVGLVDDVRPLSPVLRIVLLGAAGAVLASAGLGLEQFGIFAAAATTLLMLACTNAVNLLDGQDGLAGGLAMIAALGLAGVAGESPAWVRPTALATAGALGAFLLWNRPPARIFLGNNGAYAVGALLAALIAGAVSNGEWSALLAALLAVGVFAFEFIATVLRRVVNRGSLTGGDRDHSYDLLSERTGGRDRITLWYWLGGAFLAALGIIAARGSLVAGAAVSFSIACLATACGIRLWAQGADVDHSVGKVHPQH